MSFAFVSIVGAVLLLAGLLICVEIGYRYGKRRMRRDPSAESAGTGAIDAAIFALLGLLLAFAFAGAAGRLDTRRQQAVDEANAVGTAWLRLDLLPVDEQPAIRDLFRRYTATRLKAYDAMPDLAAMEAAWAESGQLQGELWTRARSAAQRPDAAPHAAMLVLPAFNEVIDITTTRQVALRTHIPWPVVALLVSLSLLAAVLAGHAMAARRTRPVLHTLVFATVLAITFCVMLDLEFPRVGFIRLGAADDALRQAYDAMK